MTPFQSGHMILLIITVITANLAGGWREQRSAGVMVLYFAIAWWAQGYTVHPVGILTACFAMMAWAFYRLSVTGYGDIIAAIFAGMCIAGGLSGLGLLSTETGGGSFALTYWALKGWGVAVANVLIITSALSVRSGVNG